MNKLEIQANLSIDRCGGSENLKKVIDEVTQRLETQYPDADISVRKGFFQTIDGIWANDPKIESKIKDIVADVRKKVISQQ